MIQTVSLRPREIPILEGDPADCFPEKCFPAVFSSLTWRHCNRVTACIKSYIAYLQPQWCKWPWGAVTMGTEIWLLGSLFVCPTKHFHWVRALQSMITHTWCREHHIASTFFFSVSLCLSVWSTSLSFALYSSEHSVTHFLFSPVFPPSLTRFIQCLPDNKADLFFLFLNKTSSSSGDAGSGGELMMWACRCAFRCECVSRERRGRRSKSHTVAHADH